MCVCLCVSTPKLLKNYSPVLTRFVLQYFSDKTFESSIKLFYAETLTVITTRGQSSFL